MVAWETEWAWGVERAREVERAWEVEGPREAEQFRWVDRATIEAAGAGREAKTGADFGLKLTQFYNLLC